VDDALASGAIHPWFQPQIDARTGALTGFEALARWQHPGLGLLAPGHFLDAVAEAGRIPAMGLAIRRASLAALARWDAAGGRNITVSVNAAPEDLRDPGYAEALAWDLDRNEIAPERLVVEVLETVAATSSDDTILATLAALRQQGIGLDLDDFGIGQASLLSIRRFGIGRIKIDRSFVVGIDRDPGQKEMVGAILSMARELHLQTLAEGIETEGERDTLASMGCAYLQGFALGRPMPLDDTLGWMADRIGHGMAPAPDAVMRPA
jgi:EAL domain-containing protein (putative c-di-GMP-specific phosphodiesterase class I)